VVSPKATRSFDEVVKLAYANRIQLWSDGFYRTPKIHYDKATLSGRPFYYFAYGAACTEVAIDPLTGESRVLKVDNLHDVGRSINPAIDIGQIEGGFVQGMGWLTTEQLVWNDQGKPQLPQMYVGMDACLDGLVLGRYDHAGLRVLTDFDSLPPYQKTHAQPK